MSKSVEQLVEYFQRHDRWVLLTGAGISAGSGIPTYRDARGQWLRTTPIQHQEFINHPSKRQRYWGRSMVGWPGVRDARPNPIHLAVTRLESLNRVTLIITQNVDRLHQRAGSQQVIDLHGRLDRVCCLDCGAGYEREYVQQQLLRLNPHHCDFSVQPRPDGDADLSDADVASIRPFDCEACGGMLMPDVVFFGGSVPRARVEACEQALRECHGLLVVGSSLQVYSGFRFCKQAHAMGKPIVVLNEGITRADAFADLKITDNALNILVDAVDQLLPIAPHKELACPTRVSSGSDTTYV